MIVGAATTDLSSPAYSLHLPLSIVKGAGPVMTCTIYAESCVMNLKNCQDKCDFSWGSWQLAGGGAG